MALLACRRLDIEDPARANPDRKRLVTFVEIDRCATDAIAVVTGCRLGKRALKFRDWGKMAATFVDLSPSTSPSLVVPKPSAARGRPQNPHLQSHPHSRPRVLQTERPRPLPPHRSQKRATDASLPRAPRLRPLLRAVGRRPSPPPRAPRLQIPPHRLRPLRRRHQLRPRIHPAVLCDSQPNPLPILRLPQLPLLPTPSLIMAVVCFLASVNEVSFFSLPFE